MGANSSISVGVLNRRQERGSRQKLNEMVSTLLFFDVNLKCESARMVLGMSSALKFQTAREVM
jgi:hypothetical protein